MALTSCTVIAEKEKVTIMVLKVDLQCYKCYKKVKRVLCKFPQIRDQIYDEKQNQVVIKVVCCSPEKIRDRICCKGGCAIKCIEIVEPDKTKPKEQEKPKQTEKPKETEKPKQEPEKTKEPEKQTQELPPGPCPVVPRYPRGAPCCMDCYHGRRGGPCERGYGGPALYIQYDGYCGRPIYDSYGGGQSYNNNYCVTRSDCFSEDNPQGCIVM